ncbi:carbohydrate porin [Methylocella sp.]|uniref:carbohydrate porin n=1 Tax=Methylocella sp. TaxID=1978226 RepID=UPI003783C2DC
MRQKARRRRAGSFVCAILALAAAAAGGSGARAAPADVCAGPPSILSSVAVPGLSDLKTFLCGHGVNFYGAYIGEVFGVAAGGARRAAFYDQRVEAGVFVDLETLAGLRGASFHANGFAIAGQGATDGAVYNFAAVSNVSAHPALLLFEFWAEQSLFNGLASLRVGQLAADSEFSTSEFDGLFTNATFGWATLMAADLPSGGPTYPYATPAARLLLRPIEGLTLMGAVFNGDPTGAGFDGEPYDFAPRGSRFGLHGPPFVMAEAAYAYNQSADAPAPAGRIKFGGWRHFGAFEDQRFDAAGGLLALSESGAPRMLDGDWGFYGVIDQMLWRKPNDPDFKKGVGVFARVFTAPSDRNEVSFYADAGVVTSGLVPGRPDDDFGVALAYTEISAAARGRDEAAAARSLYGRRDEIMLEAVYNALIAPGFNILPVATYVIHPGAAAPQEDGLGLRLPNALVFGLRAQLSF